MVRVEVPVPGAEMVAVEKVAVTPVGNPVPFRLTEEFNVLFPVELMVSVRLAPGTTVAALLELVTVTDGKGRTVTER